MFMERLVGKQESWIVADKRSHQHALPPANQTSKMADLRVTSHLVTLLRTSGRLENSRQMGNSYVETASTNTSTKQIMTT